MIILFFFLLMALIPFVWVISNSFKTTAEIFVSTSFFPSKFIWKNYPEAWQRARLGLRFYNSIVVVVLTTTFSLCVNTIAGYSFAKLWLRKHPAIFYCYFIGMAIPVQAIVLSIFLQLRNLGLHDTLIGLVLALVATGVPFATFLMRNFFMDLPDSFGECAQLDGSNTFQTFYHIYLPLAKPGMLALAIFVIISAWNEFNLSVVILTNDKHWTITLGVMTFRSITSGNYGLVFSAAVISFIPVLFVYILFQRNFIEGITVGGNKG
jgi:ABC-type glycerol-3-phosphate transport system permease component